MITPIVRRVRAASCLAIVALAGCGGGDGPPPSYALSVTVSGLAGSGLILLNNGGDTLAVATNGMFTFATQLTGGMAYTVTIHTQPANPSQTCLVTNGSGQAAAGNSMKVTVACTTNTYTVGGSVYGLAGASIQLSNNGSDAIAVHADGKFVFPTAVASGLAFTVTINAQPSDLSLHCTVSNGIGTVTATDVENLIIRCTKAGRFLYITEELSGPAGGGLPPGGVLAYLIDRTVNSFPAVTGSPFATDKCPCTFALSPDGGFAYVGSAGVLYPYRVDSASGALSPAGAGASISASAGTLRIDPTSRFAYVADPLTNTLSAYLIDQTDGTLAPVDGSPFATGANPHSPGFDPSGRFLYVANSGSHDISAYTVNGASGALTNVAGSPFADTGNPDTVSIDVSGKFLYATRGSSAPVASYAIDAATGALTAIAPGLLKANPAVPANALFFLDPNSNRAYAVGHCSNPGVGSCPGVGSTEPFGFDLWTFVIDDQSGVLSQSGAPQLLLTLDETSDLESVLIDPSGEFLCAREQLGAIFIETLNCHLIDPTTGAPSSAFLGGVASDDQSGANPSESWDAITIAN